MATKKAAKKTAKKTVKKVAKKAPSKATKRKEEFSDKFVWRCDDFEVIAASDVAQNEERKAAAKSTPSQPPAKGTRVERHVSVGTVLRRQFKGKEIEVEVVEGGFLYQDQTFTSLSAVARRITGYAISGPVFFKLDEPKAAE